MMMSTDKHEKYKNYQFTKEERKEILDCVREYFSLSREERLERKTLNLSNQSYANRTWFQWLPMVQKKIYDYMIKVESWPDEICGFDLDEMEQVYLDQNYYELLPFESSLTYTDSVMNEYLTSNNAKPIQSETIRRSNRTKKDLGQRQEANIRLDQKEIKRKQPISLLKLDQEENNKRKRTSLLKQRLVNQRIWLNEQAHLNEKLNDQNNNLESASYSNDFHYLNDQDFDQDFDQDLNKDRSQIHNYRSCRNKSTRTTSKSTGTRIYKTSTKKVNRNCTKSVENVKKSKADLELNYDFSDSDDSFDSLITDELNLKTRNSLEFSTKIYLTIFFITLMIIVKDYLIT